MEDIEVTLRTAYYSLLNNLTVGGVQIPLFDSSPPQEQLSPYMVWVDSRQYEDGTKSGFGTDITVILAIYDIYSGDYGGSKRIDDISNEVLKKLLPEKGVFGISLPSPLDINTMKLDSVHKDYLNRDGKRIFSKVISIKHLIFQ